jgi:DNA processing protein
MLVAATERHRAVEKSPNPEDAAYWLATSRVPHIGPVRIERLIQRFGSLAVAWSAPSEELRVVLEPRPLAELCEARRRVDPHKELAHFAERGIRVTYPGHHLYPPLLAEISGRPSVLFVRGDLIPADSVAVGIVGTRRATPQGRQIAALIGSDLGRAGVTVVSGLARGIDAAAHHAALDAGGRTIAVLGSGVDVIYPSEHRGLAERILEAGAIVSEQPPGAKPDAQNFPARNRIISGMSTGVVVIEAPMRSGALITATFAADQGREVFVVPGSVLTPSSEGSNLLLRDGARIVRSGQDILEDLNLVADGSSAAIQRSLPLDERELALYAAISSEARHIDELAEETGFTTSETATLLLTMELNGLVRNFGAQFYVRR